MLRRIIQFFGQSRNNIFEPKDPQTRLIANRSKIPFYRKLSADLIAQTADSDIDKLISYNIFAILQENKKFGSVCVNTKISEGQRAFYITRVIEGEITNGGFRQLFFNNPDEELPKLSLAAFDRINANEFSTIVSEALQLHVNEKLHSKEDTRTLEQLADSYKNDLFSVLDKRFYKANRIDPLSPDSKLNELRLRYVKENIEEFT